MTTQDQQKWDAKHAGPHAGDKPSHFLQLVFAEYALILKPGRALDLATGRGRNAIFLATKGWTVDALDFSPVALKKLKERASGGGLAVRVRQANLDQADLPVAAYDLVLNFNFLQRSLVPKMKKALKPGGYVIFETFLVDQRDLGHPKNPDYLLEHNELLDLFHDFRIFFYREGKFSDADQESFRAGIFAQRVG